MEELSALEELVDEVLEFAGDPISRDEIISGVREECTFRNLEYDEGAVLSRLRVLLVTGVIKIVPNDLPLSPSKYLHINVK